VVSWGGHTLRTEELSRDVKSLAADNNNLLTAQELLGDNGGESAKEVALAIDDDLLNAHNGQRNASSRPIFPCEANDEQRSQHQQTLIAEIPKHPQSHAQCFPAARSSSFASSHNMNCEWMLFQSVLTTCSKLDIVTVFSGGELKKRKEGQLKSSNRSAKICYFAVLLGLVVPRMLGASGRDSD